MYEYSCPDCEHDFEQLVKVDDPTLPCPKCGGDQVQKKVSQSTFKLAGGGWANDGYSS